LARWLTARGRPGELARHMDRRARQAAGMRIVARFREQLRLLYAGDLAPDDMRRGKARLFAALVEELSALDSRSGVKSRLVQELAGAPNNARLASLATYYDCVPGFQRVLAEEQHDLTRFYSAAQRLAKLPREERRAQLCAGSGKVS
jgi:predicted aminopeptidase